ncbi:hypothetical protein LR48_Vigan09g081000 [Vigna angularis]|uniref:Uncharacterized protein n=1 Tax=Phaseolus angularis TaxID=3914 RepID=A0A0L9VAQ8_PHAAN|nr:hypothetical protein LR48_Vigan09g081000 [Vigna angularis]
MTRANLYGEAKGIEEWMDQWPMCLIFVIESRIEDCRSRIEDRGSRIEDRGSRNE